MAIKPTVALREILVGSMAAYDKYMVVMKCAKIGVAFAAMTTIATAAVTATMSSKQEDASKRPSK